LDFLSTIRITHLHTKSYTLYFENSRTNIAMDISVQELLDNMKKYQVVHFATHGHVDFHAPLNSFLQVSPSEKLTLADILGATIGEVDVAVLSSCETNLPADVKILNESVSFPTGLMQGGFLSVISSLWIVNDISTALLMLKLYDLWLRAKIALPNALQAAQIWIRDSTVDEINSFLTNGAPEQIQQEVLEGSALDLLVAILMSNKKKPFEDPKHWAGFSYTGIQ